MAGTQNANIRSWKTRNRTQETVSVAEVQTLNNHSKPKRKTPAVWHTGCRRLLNQVHELRSKALTNQDQKLRINH